MDAQGGSWWSAAISYIPSLDGIKDHISTLPNSGHWKSLARRSTSSATELPGSNRSIDARSIVTLIFFFLINILVIWPIHIPLPLFLTNLKNRFFPTSTLEIDQDAASNEKGKGMERKNERMHFKLGLETAPVIGVLLLLASTCIPGSVVRDGIVGSEGVRPYDIMTLFLSFAYISISLDCTGVLQYLAHLVGMKSGSSGSFLYLAFYAFFSLTGLIIGNDPLILSGTPFLVYFTRHASIQPENQTSYLFTHFQASNLVSALLVSSNPTNLVLTSAFGISFLQYSAWLALPTVAAMIVLFPLLRWGVFRDRIPRVLNPPKVNPKDSLVDPWGGIFGTVLFIIVIILLITLSAIGLLEGVQGVWSITAPAGIIMFLRDCWHDLVVRRDGDKSRKEGLVGVKNGREMTDVGRRGSIGVEAGEPRQSEKPVEGSASPVKADVDINASSAKKETSTPDQSDSSPEPPAADPLTTTTSSSSAPDRSPTPTPATKTASSPTKTPTLLKPIRKFTKTFPTASLVISRLPLQLIPFAFSMFILVEALSYTGWIRVFATWWTAWVKVGGLPGAIWLMGMISVLGCNAFGTNIGATVLLSRILQQWQASEGVVSNRILYGSVFTLAVGSNFGAYSFVFSASLAGLLWRNILHQKGLAISQKEFIKWNTVPVIVTMIVGCLVVAGEVCVMYKS